MPARLLAPISLAAAFAAILLSAAILSGSSNIFLSIAGIGTENHDSLHEASASKLPMDVRQSFKNYDKAGDANGSEKYLKINDDFIDPDNHCEFCARIEYSPGPKGEAAVFYKNDKAIDISSAKRVVFFAKGEKGDETVQFMAAGSGLEGKKTGNSLYDNEQTAVKTKNVKLDNDWKRYEIDLSKSNSLSKVTHAFGFKAQKGEGATDSGTVVFYVKGILFDTNNASSPVPLEEQVTS